MPHYSEDLIFLLFFYPTIVLIAIAWINFSTRRKIKNNALMWIEKYYKHEYFLINYEFQVRAFALTLETYKLTKVMMFDFIDPELKYQISGKYLSLVYEEKLYTLGILPEGISHKEFWEGVVNKSLESKNMEVIE